MNVMASLQTRAEQALEFARKKAATCETWPELSNAIFGIGGKFSELFPTQSDRVAFSKTDEYAEIQQLIAGLPGPGHATDPEAASGRFVLRLPKSLHAAMIAEAEAEGVSLNQLCVAKLSVQLRAEVRDPSSTQPLSMAK